MTRMELLFMLGVALISLSVTYSLWVKVRVAHLRQDIFDKRDELFDTAMELKAFDDPAYREARDHLNALAHIAKYLSIPLMTHTFGESTEAGPEHKSENIQMQNAIDEIFEWSAERIVNYLLRETLSGFILSRIANPVLKKTSIVHKSADRVESWIRSGVPIEIDRFRGKPSRVYVKRTA